MKIDDLIEGYVIQADLTTAASANLAEVLHGFTAWLNLHGYLIVPSEELR